jgi:hypothetical protein
MKISRIFKGIAVREARGNLLVQPNKRDIESALPEDPEHCAYARCIRRTLECENVFVFKTVAYIEVLDRKGKPTMERYIVRKHAKEFLVKFDGGERVAPGGFTFHAPSRCNTLDYKAEQTRAYRRSPHARITGERIRATSYSLRHGTGQVHFIGKGVITRHLK